MRREESLHSIAARLAARRPLSGHNARDRGRRTTASNVVGRSFRAVREYTGISQERLALKAGVARTYVGRVERGVLNPTMSSLLRLLAALGVSCQTFGTYVDIELAAQKSRRRAPVNDAQPKPM